MSLEAKTSSEVVSETVTGYLQRGLNILGNGVMVKIQITGVGSLKFTSEASNAVIIEIELLNACMVHREDIEFELSLVYAKIVSFITPNTLRRSNLHGTTISILLGGL